MLRESDLKVLVIGSGGREHALASTLASSPLVRSVFSMPGNAGMAAVGECIQIPVWDTDAVCGWAKANSIDLAVCGPEVPLINGLGDAFLAAGIPFFGPLAYGARLEGSKIFAKEVMRESGVPTAEWTACEDYKSALVVAVERVEREGGVVIKADGEAAGKGVFVCSTVEEAQSALEVIMVDRVFGASGDRVLVEERLSGQEASVMVIANGESLVAMPPVQDHKRAYDNDLGPNTGGMGCYCPVPAMPAGLHQTAIETAVRPILEWMGIRGKPYFGCLYAGLMITTNGLKVLEYNCRFGDPETQVVLPMMRTDLAEVLIAAVANRLDEIQPIWYDGAGVCVVLASGGYPGQYQTSFPIEGLEEASAVDGVSVYQAGTAIEGGRVVTAGGRVLSVTALGASFPDARSKAYDACSRIRFENQHFRKDIGARVS